MDEEETPALPVISNEGVYWSGKDYANTYKEDFKDVAEFVKGLFQFLNDCHWKNLEMQKCKIKIFNYLNLI